MKKVLTINNETWEIFVGKNNAVIKNPRDERKSIFTFEMITGRPAEVIEKGRKNKNRDGMVTPADLKAFIQRQFPLEEE